MSGCGCKACEMGQSCPGGVCPTPRQNGLRYADPAAEFTEVYSAGQGAGYLGMLGMVDPVYTAPRGARLTAEEVALARANLDAQLARERAAREERDAARAAADAREGRTYGAIGSGISTAGELAGAGIRTAGEIEQARIAAARDEAVARARADADTQAALTRRAEIERGGYQSTGTLGGMDATTVLALGGVAAAVLYFATRKKRGRGRR